MKRHLIGEGAATLCGLDWRALSSMELTGFCAPVTCPKCREEINACTR